MTPNEEKEREAFEADVMPQLMPAGKDHPFLMRNSKGDYSHEWMQNRWEGWQAGRAALMAESEAVWISVDDRLPDIDYDKGYSANVLGVCDGMIGVFNRYYVEGEGWMWAKAYSILGGLQDAECEADDDYNVTLWMPIPAAPRERRTVGAS